MNVLLAHSNMLAHDPKQTAKMQPYAPLATLYAAGALRAAGQNADLVFIGDSITQGWEDAGRPPLRLQDVRPVQRVRTAR